MNFLRLIGMVLHQTMNAVLVYIPFPFNLIVLFMLFSAATGAVASFSHAAATGALAVLASGLGMVSILAWAVAIGYLIFGWRRGQRVLDLNPVPRAASPIAQVFVAQPITPASAAAAHLANSPAPAAVAPTSALAAAKRNATLCEVLQARVYGQDDSCEELAAKMLAKASKARKSGPTLVSLFAGPPGCGKTTLVEALGGAFKLPADRILTLDCSQLSSPLSVDSLLGQPGSGGGPGTPGALTAALKANPFSIIVFDRIDSAPAAVVARIGSLLGGASLLDVGLNERVDISQAVIIFGFDAGRDITDLISKDRAGSGKAIRKKIGEVIDAKTMSAIDYIFTFAPLGRRDTCKLLGHAIKRICSDYGLSITGVEPDVLRDLLLSTADLAATEYDRHIEDEIGLQLARLKHRGARRVVALAAETGIVMESDQ